jgi:hypothetical protein
MQISMASSENCCASPTQRRNQKPKNDSHQTSPFLAQHLRPEPNLPSPKGPLLLARIVASVRGLHGSAGSRSPMRHWPIADFGMGLHVHQSENKLLVQELAGDSYFRPQVVPRTSLLSASAVPTAILSTYGSSAIVRNSCCWMPSDVSSLPTTWTAMLLPGAPGSKSISAALAFTNVAFAAGAQTMRHYRPREAA